MLLIKGVPDLGDFKALRVILYFDDLVQELFFFQSRRKQQFFERLSLFQDQISTTSRIL